MLNYQRVECLSTKTWWLCVIFVLETWHARAKHTGVHHDVSWGLSRSWVTHLRMLRCWDMSWAMRIIPIKRYRQPARHSSGDRCGMLWDVMLTIVVKQEYIINFISTCFPKDTMFIYVWTFFSGSFLALFLFLAIWRQDHKDLVEAAKQRKPPPGLTMQELCCLQTLLLTSFHGATNFGDPLPRWKTHEKPGWCWGWVVGNDGGSEFDISLVWFGMSLMIDDYCINILFYYYTTILYYILLLLLYIYIYILSVSLLFL